MKNIYEYLEESEVVDNACAAAAKCLIENDISVVPLNGKEPVKGIKISLLKSAPLHAGNYSFYFDKTDTEIGIILSKSMEVIDIDEQHYPGITKRVMPALEQARPELFEKLTICKTKSGGAHIEYLSEIVGGASDLAKRPDNPNPVTFIERIDETNKSYIKTAPSKGYHYTQRNPIDMQWLSAEERGWLISFLCSFNEVHIPEVKKGDFKREDSPWNMFNKAKDWTYIVQELQERGWETVADYGDERCSVNRPGSSQRHSGTIWKKSKVLYLFTHASEFEPNKSYTPFGIYCHFYHNGNVYSASKQLAAEGYGVDISTEGQFWRKDGKKIIVKYTELVNWLNGIGYYRYENEIVQVINNRVRICDPSDMKIAFLNEVEPDMKDYFYEKVSTIFADNGGLIAMMPKLNLPFLNDDSETTWLFFSNCAVKINSTGASHILYNQLDGLIWETAIIERKIYPADFTDFDVHKFIKILGGGNHEKLEQLIGYAISRYKDPMIAKAIVIMEDIDADNEGESQGRSGKGLIFQVIRKFRKTCQLNGKGLSFHNAFLWQGVDLDTDLVFIDDVEKKFPFEKLYSIITDGILVNKKGIKEISIPYDKSPKIFITSNFAVGSMDDSAKDRKFEFPVVKHFSSKHKPVHEFGRPFFSGWSDKEWNKFDSYIIYCCGKWLESKNPDINVVTENSADRALVHDTSKEFVDYMDDQLLNRFFDFAPAMLKNATRIENGVTTTNAINLLSLMSHQHDPDYYLVMDKTSFLEKVSIATKFKGLGMVTLTRWIKKWSEARNVKIDTSYKRTSAASRQYRVEWFPELDTTELNSKEWEQSVI